MSFLAFAQDQCALGRAAEAERQLLAQFPQQPFPPSADYGLALAYCNLSLEKLDQVEVCLGRVAADHGDSGPLLQLALACARRRGEGSCLPRFRQRLKPFLDQQPIALEWLQLLQEDLDGAAAKAWAVQLLRRWPHGVAVLEAVRALAWQLQDPVLLGQAGSDSGPAALLWQGRQRWLLGDQPTAEELLRRCLADGSIPLAVQYQALQTLVGQVLPHQVEKLLAAFPQFLRVSPDWAWSIGRHYLAAGAWAKGWPLYEQRYASGDRAQILPPGFPLRGLEQLQQARALAGRHVLLYGEQGIGDMLMFGSLLPELLAEAASVRLLLPPRLVELFQYSFPTALVASSFKAADLDQGQLAFSIGSLGGVYRLRAEDFQGHGPHLWVGPSARQAWRLRLEQLGPGAKVGIAWRGGGSLGSRVQRSLELEQLLPLLQLPGVRWINLQYGLGPTELEDFERSHGIRLHHFEGIGENLQATAALTAALDLVITVQQTALHIAGGLGVPAWVLVPAVAEWRYGLEGASMPWYSSVQLFRQQQAGMWQSVIGALVQRLRAWLVGHNGANNCLGPGPKPHSDGDRP